MKVVCISDTHDRHRELILPPGDMLIHAGDLTRLGEVAKLNDFFAWCNELDYQYKIVIAGNHDFALEQCDPDIIIPSGITYLENQATVLNGLTIWGSPICPPYYNWAFMWDIAKRKVLYQNIPDNVDIIINHSPVYGILDWANKGCNAGCIALQERLALLNPKLVVTGHIHEDYGIKKIDNTIYVNASILNKRYQIANSPIIIEL